jgi:hypothetical protein
MTFDKLHTIESFNDIDRNDGLRICDYCGTYHKEDELFKIEILHHTYMACKKCYDSFDVCLLCGEKIPTGFVLTHEGYCHKECFED